MQRTSSSPGTSLPTNSSALADQTIRSIENIVQSKCSTVCSSKLFGSLSSSDLSPHFSGVSEHDTNHQMPHGTPDNPSFALAPELADPRSTMSTGPTQIQINLARTTRWPAPAGSVEALLNHSAHRPSSFSELSPLESSAHLRREASTPGNPYQIFSNKMAPPSSEGRSLGHKLALPYAAWSSSFYGSVRAPPKSNTQVCGGANLPPSDSFHNLGAGSMAPISSSEHLRSVHKLAPPYAAWSSSINSESLAPPESSTQVFRNASTPSNPCQNFQASRAATTRTYGQPSSIYRLETPCSTAKASNERDTFLLSERNEKRQKTAQIAAAQLSDKLNPGASHIGSQEGHNHLVSPKEQDLIWESMKHYCAMVLDKESREFLGTAVLFVQQQPVYTDQHLEARLPRAHQSAWVTSVNALAGREQVLVQNSNGESHLAVLLLTSVTFGLVFLSVHKMSATFGLAFLSMMTSPSSLPRRCFVDAKHGDMVYVLGYEVNSEEEQTWTIPVVHLKLGRIVPDAGGKQLDNNNVVEIDFASSMAGGARSTPLKGFLGGLIVRADGLWTGLITCNDTLGSYRSVTDFVLASKVYSLLKEI